MASALSIIAIYTTVDADSPDVWFWTFSDSLNSICAHIVILLSILLPVLLSWMFSCDKSKLESNYFGAMLVELLEDFRFDNKYTRGYISY